MHNASQRIQNQPQRSIQRNSVPASPSVSNVAVDGFATTSHYGFTNQAPFVQPLYSYSAAQFGLLSPPITPTPSEDAWQHAQFLDPSRKLCVEKILGNGAYGVVQLVRDVTTNRQYAVKALNKFTPDGSRVDSRTRNFQRTEMALHHRASAHPNIVSLLRVIDNHEHTHVVMEYCPEGDLFTNITEHGRYVGNFVAAQKVFLQILDAVSHCHSLGIYHRDLKPENILVAQGGHQVKLADFGLATTDSISHEFGCGSTFYMSPECQDQSSRTPYYACVPNDIWSLGVILVNLTCGRNPWRVASAKDSTFKAFMGNRDFLKTILPLSDELNEILCMIFELDPAKRISLSELRHRIVHCPRFNKGAMQYDALPTPTTVFVPTYVDQFQGPPSPASTTYSDDSMVSDHSDSSSSPSLSEYGSDSDDVAVTFMDDEVAPSADVSPVLASVKVDPYFECYQQAIPIPFQYGCHPFTARYIY